MSRTFGFKREDRLAQASEIRRIIHSGKRISNKYFTLFFWVGSTKKRRLGVSFGKRAGGAVVRNRAKRIIREYFRVHRECLLAGLSLLVVARGDLSALNARQIRGSLEALLQRAKLFAHESPECPS
jgi:ribonuclease P protein component